MIFASAGARLQTKTLAKHRNFLFLFDDTADKDVATASISGWAKEVLKARSAGFVLEDDTLTGTPASGVKAGKYYFAYTAFAESMVKDTQSTAYNSVDLDTTRNEYRYKKWLTVNGFNFRQMNDRNYGPVSDFNPTLDDTWDRYFFTSRAQMVLVPESVSGKVTGLRCTANETRPTYYSNTYANGDRASATTSYNTMTYNMASDALQITVSAMPMNISPALSLSLYEGALPEGFVIPTSVYRRVYTPNQGAISSSYYRGMAFGQDILTVSEKFFGVTSLATTPDFDFAWAASMIWNEERFIGQVLTRGQDFEQQQKGSTRVNPVLNLDPDLLSPEYETIFLV